jgi:hypothetical protein
LFKFILSTKYLNLEVMVRKCSIYSSQPGVNLNLQTLKADDGLKLLLHFPMFTNDFLLN